MQNLTCPSWRSRLKRPPRGSPCPSPRYNPLPQPWAVPMLLRLCLQVHPGAGMPPMSLCRYIREQEAKAYAFDKQTAGTYIMPCQTA